MTLAAVPRYDPGHVSEFGEHALVVGSSVAGLVAARVLADGFETVTILEKDPLPPEPSPRQGVPQGSHIHALLEAGRATLEDLLPGFGEALLSAGGLMIDGATDITYYEEGGVLADGTRRFPAYSASRPLFEHVIRQLVTDRADVRLRSGCQVIGYLEADDGDGVTGVELRGRTADLEELPAELVVDATGRTSRTPAWLADHGYPSPPVDEVAVDIGYSTVAIERPPADRRAILGIASHPNTRGGAAFPVEDGRWLVNVHGVHGDHPPTDVAGLREFAESLHVPEIHRLLDAYPIVSGEADFYPFPSNRRRRYEALETFPEGLVVVGDALASFNPIYGQGMSVAALEALGLHHCLGDGGLDDLPLRFFERAEPLVDVPWMMAVGADFQFPETTGPKPRGTDLFGRYLSRLMRRAHDDGRLRDALFGVINMERPPTALLRPGIAWSVMKPRVPTTPSGSNAAMEEGAPAAGDHPS